jgi:hypothetical protein
MIAILALLTLSLPRPIHAQTPPLSPSDLLLPDLEPFPPTDLWIEFAYPGPQRLLRFTNTVANSGDGPLELWGSEGWFIGIQTALQRLYTPDGRYEERFAGAFEWHDAHIHWHFSQGFVSYDLWAVAEDGSLAHPAALSEKLTWCLVDTFPFGPYQPPVYFDCLPNYQGIAAGWADVYTSDLEGQSLDITSVPDGVYAVRVLANPDHTIIERDYDNNIALTYVQLDGGNVTILEPPSPVQFLRGVTTHEP